MKRARFDKPKIAGGNLLCEFHTGGDVKKVMLLIRIED